MRRNASRVRSCAQAAEITRHARQNLVARLDGYQREHPLTFAAVIEAIDADFLPACRRHALVGEARVAITSSVPIASFDTPHAMDMAVDVMFDRGFALRVEERPGEYRFKITFDPPHLHNVAEGNLAQAALR